MGMVTEKAHEQGWLSASFFFLRSKDDHKSAKLLFGTVIFQLLQFSKEISLCVGKALELKLDMSEKQLQDQLWYLIIQPLQSCKNKSTIFIVINAFNECDKQDTEWLLSLLLQEICKVPNLKILFTTWPKWHILNILHCHKVHHLYWLHDIKTLVVEGESKLSQTCVVLGSSQNCPLWVRATDLDTLLVRFQCSC